MFRLWVWVYTGWGQQSAITFKDAIDVLFSGSLVMGLQDKIERKKQVHLTSLKIFIWEE